MAYKRPHKVRKAAAEFNARGEKTEARKQAIEHVESVLSTPERKTTTAGNGTAQPTTKQPTLAEKIESAKKAHAAADPRPKRKCNWRWLQPGGPFGILHIDNGVSADYFVQRLGLDVFLLMKMEQDRTTCYTVFFGDVSFCGCDSFKKGPKVHGATHTCKHIECLRTLAVENKLPTLS